MRLVAASAVTLSMMVSFSASAEEAKTTEPSIRPVGVVNAGNGSVFPVGKYGIILKHYYTSYDQLYDGNDKVDFTAPQAGSGPQKKVSEKISQQYQMVLRTGVYKDFDIRMIIPYFDKTVDFVTPQRSYSTSNSGIGDIKILSRYRIMSQKNGPLNIALGLGGSIPTGSTDDTDSSGKTLPGFLQTGSGSWNPMAELGMHKVMGRHWLSSYFMYQLATEGELGDNDFKRPDVFKYNVGYTYALSGLFDLGIELNGLIKSKAELNGISQDNTGGHSLYISPQLHIKITKGLHFDVCAPVAVYHDLNGEQLAEDYQIITKLAWTF